MHFYAYNNNLNPNYKEYKKKVVKIVDRKV